MGPNIPGPTPTRAKASSIPAPDTIRHGSSIVISAYQCAPGQGSVSQIGWEWYYRLARRRPVLLVTHIRNKVHIDTSTEQPADSDILYIDTEWFAGPLFRLARRLFPRSEHSVFLLTSLDFFIFDWLALRALRRRLKAGACPSVVHVVTPVTRAAPTALHRLGLPLVRGPLNCGLQSPKGFQRQLHDESSWIIRLRELPKLLDAVIGATRQAAVLLTATKATWLDIPKHYRSKTLMMLENGIDLNDFPTSPWPKAPCCSVPLRILFVGRMITLKGVDMLLEAFARLKLRGILTELTLVGDGPARDQWEQLTNLLQLRESVRFTGALSRNDVQCEMRNCHVFCLPSVRESGGAVLIEAMATARPVIALNYGGPAELVDDTVGRAIPLQSPAQVIFDLELALAEVARAPESWARRGSNGRARVEQCYEWEQKISTAEAIYDKLNP